MLPAIVKALTQLVSPPMRAVLWKSVGLAIALIVVVGIGLQRALSWLAGQGEVWLAGALGPSFTIPVDVLAWIVSIAASLGIVLGAIFLMPAITALVASVFVDDVAAEVERVHYPADRPGVAQPVGRALIEGGKTALLAIGVYLLALPLIFFGIGVIAFFVATAWLLGREYFLLAAMRQRPPQEARTMRRTHAVTIFLAGLAIAAFVAIPIVNLATPLFGTALMVHLHKRLSGPGPELLDPAAIGRIAA